MKYYLKMIGLVALGLLTAIVFYPFLHEAGHAVAAFVVGAKVVEFHIFPIPFVVCEMSAVSGLQQAAVGLAGVVFPFVLSILWHPKSFWVWYVNIILQGISVYAIVLSIRAALLYMNGRSLPDEDVVKVFHFVPDSLGVILAGLCIMGVCGIIRLAKERVLSKSVAYFETPQKVSPNKKAEVL